MHDKEVPGLFGCGMLVMQKVRAFCGTCSTVVKTGYHDKNPVTHGSCCKLEAKFGDGQSCQQPTDYDSRCVCSGTTVTAPDRGHCGRCDVH